MLFKIDEDSKFVISRLWSDYISKYKVKVFIAIFCMIITSAGLAIQVQMLEPIFNSLQAGAEIQFFVNIGIIYCGLGIIKGISNYIQAILVGKIGLFVLKDLQVDMFESLIKQDISYLEQGGASKHLSRFTHDVGILRQFSLTFIINFGKDVFSAIFLFGVMLYNSVELTVGAIVVIPFILLPILIVGKKIRKITTDEQEYVGSVVSLIDENLKGVRQVKSFNIISYSSDKLKEGFTKLFRISFMNVKNEAILIPIIEIIIGLTISFIIILGGYSVVNSDLNGGKFTAFLIAMTSIYRPLKSLSNANSLLQSAVSAGIRVFGVIDKMPNIKNNQVSLKSGIENPKIVFKDVKFSYDDNSLLNNINFEFGDNKSFALIGKSGCGKSSIISLIMRFYDTTHGEILINDVNVKDYDTEYLRQSISYVGQDTMLFNVSIYENVKVGKLDATKEEVMIALEKADAMGFVDKLPGKLDYIVGERGLGLSGGQRQRIALARAFLKDAPIVILDEATSALDIKASDNIQKIIDTVLKDKLVIIVSHKIDNIKTCDRVIMINEGSIKYDGEFNINEINY